MGRSGYYPRTIIDQSKRVKIKYKKNNEVELYRIGPVGLVFCDFYVVSYVTDRPNT